MKTFLTEKEINIIRGKAMVGPIEGKEVLQLFDIFDQLEQMLDEADQDDYFGTQGWRYHFGWEN